jgi:hypothetical protein
MTPTYLIADAGLALVRAMTLGFFLFWGGLSFWMLSRLLRRGPKG